MTWGWNVPSPLPSSTDTSLESVVGDGQVGAAVAGEVARHDGVWSRTPPRRSPGAGTCRRRCPGSTDTSFESLVGDGQVGAAVAGEVARHDGVWSRTVRVNRDRLKRWSGWR